MLLESGSQISAVMARGGDLPVMVEEAGDNFRVVQNIGRRRRSKDVGMREAAPSCGNAANMIEMGMYHQRFVQLLAPPASDNRLAESLALAVVPHSISTS